jgi:predicted Zn-dependent peptidase
VTVDAVNALAKQHFPRAKASIAVIAPKKAAAKKN